MKYDVILIMVPPWEPSMPPLGLAYISEYLRSRNFNPKVIDFNLELFRKASPEKKIFWEIYNINSMTVPEITEKISALFKREIDDLVEQINSCDCNLIGFSVNVTSIALAAKLATLIKKRDKGKKIILGGSGCFWNYDRRLIFGEDAGSIDAFVIGEGEKPLVNIIENHQKNKTFEGIKGVICRKGDFFKPAVPFYTENIDELPFPNFSDFEFNSYKKKQLPIIISRGCIGRCAFCIDHLMCGPYRFRSPEKLIKEIEYHVKTNKKINFVLNDLICNGNLKQLDRFCELVIESGFDISWGSYAMVRKEMSLELLRKMKAAGCVQLCYGVESGCDRTLKRMNKFYCAADAERVIKLTHEAEILASINIIVGFPEETEADFQETLSFIKRNKDYIYEVTNISSFVIMSPSKLGSNPERYGVKLPLPDDFNSCYVDNNGVDIKERIRRARRTIFLTANLGLKTLIINYNLRNDNVRDSGTLVFCPVAKINSPPLEAARLLNNFKRMKFTSFFYDFNIKLYKAAPDKFKVLWDYQNWYLWVFPDHLENIFEVLGKEVFAFCEELASLETNNFYFLLNRENFMFSIKIGAVIQKYNPNVNINFISSVFKKEDWRALVPKGLTGVKFIYDDEGIIKAISDVSPRKKNLSGEMIAAAESVDFKAFNLKNYESPKLPLSIYINEK